MISRIIIEGPDCSGKSTVVERIKNTLRWDSKSLHHIEGNQYSRYLKEYALNEKTVFDRSHFSEAVYSELWSSGSPFSTRERQILDQVTQNDSMIIFACPTLEKMRERYEARDFQQQISLSELERARELFIKQMKNITHILYLSETYEELDCIIGTVQEVVDEAICYAR